VDDDVGYCNTGEQTNATPHNAPRPQDTTPQTTNNSLTLINAIDRLGLLGDAHGLRGHDELADAGVQSEPFHAVAVSEYQLGGAAVRAVARAHDLNSVGGGKGRGKRRKEKGREGEKEMGQQRCASRTQTQQGR